MDNAEDLETDLEIAQADQRAYQDLIRSIVQNRRLAWEIVSAWLEANGYLLIPKNYTGQVNQGNNEKARE